MVGDRFSCGSPDKYRDANSNGNSDGYTNADAHAYFYADPDTWSAGANV